MQGRTHHHGGAGVAEPVDRPRTPTGAVVWIDPNRAIVARTTPAGAPVVSELRRLPGPLGELGPFLADVVDEVGDRDRVVILGPDAMRVELEREYVTILHRLDRLVDVEQAAEAEDRELLDRLLRLMAG